MYTVSSICSRAALISPAFIRPAFIAAALSAAVPMAGGDVASAEGLYVKPLAPRASLVPDSAFYVGLGGSFNAMHYGTQDVYAVGTSNVYLGGALQSFGSALGPAYIDLEDQNNISFAVQGGYFQRFNNSDMLWGVKFAYSYLNGSSSVRNALLPQVGSFTTVPGGVVTPFTGNALVRSYKVEMLHQMALIPFIGRSFSRGFVYGGVGPTLSQISTKLDGVIGFADLNGTRTDVSGNPINLSSTRWVYGGAATVGGTYFLDASWFLDFSYTFAMTQNNNNDYFSPFTNPNGTGGSTIEGTLVGTTSGKVTTQSVTVSINRAF